MTQEIVLYYRAAELMTKTGQSVTLKVAKQGAIYHGLATLLSQPSPVMQRASPQKGPMTPSKQRPGEEGPPPYNGVPENDRARPGIPKSDSRTLPRDLQRQALRGPDSRSSPALNSKYRVAFLVWNNLLYMEFCNYGNCTRTHCTIGKLRCLHNVAK